MNATAFETSKREHFHDMCDLTRVLQTRADLTNHFQQIQRNIKARARSTWNICQRGKTGPPGINVQRNSTFILMFNVSSVYFDV